MRYNARSGGQPKGMVTRVKVMMTGGERSGKGELD